MRPSLKVSVLVSNIGTDVSTDLFVTVYPLHTHDKECLLKEEKNILIKPTYIYLEIEFTIKLIKALL